MSLTSYKQKRNFKKTPEPAGRKKAAASALSFVVQRHDASHLHYDFRLQVDGVLKSWAIPKGPSMNPADKRLAMMVEDHPLEYGKFEGEIPEGNYGAGSVEIWDNGTYEPENIADRDDYESEMRKGLKKGSLKFVMHGKKLKGSFALVRLKSAKENSWLLIKHNDEFARDEYNIEEERGTKPKRAVKQNTKTKRAHSDTAALESVPRSVRAETSKIEHYIQPMSAQIGNGAFDNPDWIFEIKWDGYRAIAEIKKKEILFYSRNGLSFDRLYVPIVEALQKLKDDVVLDGEVVVLDKNDKPSFQKLQQYRDNRSLPLIYYIFDCLSYKGKDLTGLPLVERKKIAEKIIPKNSNVLRYSDHVTGDGIAFFEHAVKLGLEGIIAKRADSKYSVGHRTSDWLKIKNHNTQEAVITGYTEPRKSRQYFGALVLGMYEDGKLKYIGHTGTGFTEKILKEIYTTLQPLVRDTSPFEEKVPINGAVTWVKPVQVCEIKYTEVTDEGILRHPVFMGLRIDKQAKEVDHLDVAVPAKKKSPRKTTTTTRAKKPAKNRSPKTRNETSAANRDQNSVMKVNGHEVSVTHLDKVYWPDEGITKGDVIDYYNSIYKYILPYLKDRPQSLKRNPNGIADKGFFHKDAAEGAPAWVEHLSLYSESANKDIDYIICNNRATLLYMNNLGCIEINPWNSRIGDLDKPDYLVMDIDPSDKNSFDEVIDAALAIKEVLDQAGASSFCKTSGASGLHVYVPLAARYTYDQARSFAEIVASLTHDLLPDITTMERSLSKRKDRIYLDYLQNKRGQTLASVYSLRPVPGATISTPLEWKEVKHGLTPSQFTIQSLPKRLSKKGDLFTAVLRKGIDLAKCLQKLERV
ncbi:MAG TPA: DNA ligase D [Ohtaekwangia sp.]|uniref:DNA ligase D n=1 Tax=Ohtaekwangia sp. TaxID=2066019 RepID=UPI002F93D215